MFFHAFSHTVHTKTSLRKLFQKWSLLKTQYFENALFLLWTAESGSFRKRRRKKGHILSFPSASPVVIEPGRVMKMAFFTSVVDLQTALSASLTARDSETLTSANF